MNKFAKLFAGMAVISLAASCSSDEPMGGNNNGADFADGSNLYLAVTIQDANSRAEMSDMGFPEQTNPFYYDGDAQEHAVKSARFFFFDNKGVFVGEANVWRPGTANDPNNTQNNNIEYASKTMVVLKGQTAKSAPKYMLTVVNCPVDFTNESTIQGTAQKLVGLYRNEKASEKEFVMTTTSFYDDENKYKGLYDSKYPYANVVTADNFYTEPKNGQINPDAIENPVEVYVERLASKVEMIYDFTDSKGQPVTLTLAGAPNNEGGSVSGGVDNTDNIAKTTVYVKLDGFGVTNVEKSSYLSKNVDKWLGKGAAFDENPFEWESWNNVNDHRSFWAMSPNYEKDAPELYRSSVFQIDQNSAKKAVYTFETTNTLANVLTGTFNKDAVKKNRVYDNNVPCVVFSATVTDEAGKALDMVLYNGIYYKWDSFKDYALDRIAADGKLNFYTQFDKKVTTTVTDGEDKTTTKTEILNVFEQIDSSFVELVQVKTGKPYVKLQVKKAALEGKTFYSKDEKKDEFVIAGTAEEIAKQIQDDLDYFLTVNSGAQAEAFKGGRTYYTVPVKHLRANSVATLTDPYLVNAEGQYGLVRNHWYQIAVGKIMKLGHGVFNPGDGEDGDIIETEIPKDDTYGLGATINIVTWRIVCQSVDL